MATTTHPIPTWYKPSPLWPIPQDWEVLELRNLGVFSKWKWVSKEELKENWFPCIRYWEIYTTHDYVIKKFNSFIDQESADNSQEIKKWDILFAWSGETIEDIGKSVAYIGNEKAYAWGDVIILSTNNKVNTECLSYLLETDSSRKQKRRFWQWHSVVHIYPNSLSKIILALPPLREQTAIATILSTVDTTIQQTQEIIGKLEARNKGLVQKLLTGKIRVKGFSWDPEFHILWKYIEEISIKNKNGQIDNVLSVTNSRGFINQSEQFEREVASVDRSNYKIVKKWQFAYNPSRVNVWSIDLLRNFEEGILSPMYVVFETLQSKLLPEFLYYHLKSRRFFGHIPMFVQWSVRDSLWFDWLSGMKFFIPSIEEQKKITEILNKATEEVKKQKQKLVKLQTLKKWLMQQLLTWKVRVKKFRQ